MFFRYFIGFIFLTLSLIFFFRLNLESHVLSHLVDFQNRSMELKISTNLTGFGGVNSYTLHKRYIAFEENANIETRYFYAKELILIGQIDYGIALLEEIMVPLNFNYIDENILFKYYYLLIGAYLKKSEINHCLETYSPNACIVPLIDDSLQHNPKYIYSVIKYIVLTKKSFDDPFFDWLDLLANHLIGNNTLNEFTIPNSNLNFKSVTGDFSLTSLAGSAIIDDFNRSP